MNPSSLELTRPITCPVTLCQRCQPWKGLDIHDLSLGYVDISLPTKSSVSIEQLNLSTDCILCCALLTAYHSQSTQLSQVRSWPPSCLTLEVEGPYYLDNFFLEEEPNPLYRSDTTSEPGFIIVNILLKIIIQKEDPNLVTSVGSPPNLCHGENNGHLELAEPLLEMTPQFRMVYVNTSKPFLCRIEDWEVPYFNINVLKGWLRHCEHYHGEKCKGLVNSNKGFVETIRRCKKLFKRPRRFRSLADVPCGFRVICTKEWKVIQPQCQVRYVALSYLWNSGTGKNVQLETGNISSLELPGGLSRLQIPNIIRDAVALCQQLDEPYLWIDRFCIVQDDLGMKSEQIKAMGRIYHSAAFTIVAALNTRDAAGLPGFISCPRHPRSSALRPPLRLTVEGRGFSGSFGVTSLIEECINSTLWNKRGWTFQERLLSNRCLYITESQVIFECSVERGFEIFTWGPPRVESDPRTTPGHGIKQVLENIKPSSLEATASSYIWSSCFPIHAFEDSSIDVNINQELTLDHYKSWVGDFTSRQLSYKRDILNAFEGLASVLAGSFRNTAMLFGLPEIYLADCLLWRTARISGYRAETPEIPSWSWGSSSEAVHYFQYEEMASIVIFHYQDPDRGKLRKLNVQEKWLRVIISIEALAKQNDLPEFPGIRYLPSDQTTNRDWKECPHNPWQAVAHELSLDGDACAVAGQYPGSLIFNTTIASMKVGHLLAPERDYPRSPYYDAVLFSMNGDRVGQLFGREETWKRAGGDTRPCDILVLSGGMAKKSVRRDFCWDDRFGDLWFLNVMLVERLSHKPFVARRIAVGTVVMSKWRDCNPKWETVVLI